MLVTDESPSPPISSAVVTILRTPEDASSTDIPAEQIYRPISFDACVASIQDSVMLLRAQKQTLAGSALKIETADALWLGEAEKCDHEDDSWLIRVRLRHVLRDFDTLTRLAERFGTAAPKKVSVQA